MSLIESDYLLWLTRIDGIGIIKQQRLLDYFGSAKEVFNAEAFSLSEVNGLTKYNVQSIYASRKEKIIDEYKRELEQKNIRFVSISDEEYPSLLKEIHEPPTGIYVMGELPEDELLKISVIGSRRCSEYGLTVSKKLSKELCVFGAVIVSGMARGIDSMAHQGALEAGGKTIAVMGCGVDICYPAENRRLRQRIMENGCLISEFPPSTEPRPGFFRMRNRIISGLSVGTLVVEAALKSGTRITANQALEQGRQVMAVPGSIYSKLSEGTNELIREGAALISDYKDVLDALGVYIDEGENNKVEKSQNNLYLSLAPEEKLVYDCINFDPVTVDFIIEKLNSQANVVNHILTMLEIGGMVKRLPGQRFIRAF